MELTLNKKGYKRQAKGILIFFLVMSLLFFAVDFIFTHMSLEDTEMAELLFTLQTLFTLVFAFIGLISVVYVTVVVFKLYLMSTTDVEHYFKLTDTGIEVKSPLTSKVTKFDYSSINTLKIDIKGVEGIISFTIKRKSFLSQVLLGLQYERVFIFKSDYETVKYKVQLKRPDLQIQVVNKQKANK